MREKTFWAKIYVSGSTERIKECCREYCLNIGLCVTVTETLFIYTGGEEYGIEIGLINYPRFPDTSEGILSKAIELAAKCRDEAYQWSYLVITPDITIWDSKRENK